MLIFGTSYNRDTKSDDSKETTTKLDGIFQGTSENPTQNEEIREQTENDAAPGNDGKQSENGTEKAVLDETLSQKHTMSFITPPTLGTQEFTAPISSRSTTTTSMSASSRYFTGRGGI